MLTGRPPASAHEVRFDLFSTEQLLELVRAGVPVGRRERNPRADRRIFRDIYVDTPDGTLRRRGAVCRLRIGADDRRELILRWTDPATASNGTAPDAPTSVRSVVRAADPSAALLEDTPVGRRLRAFVDIERLQTLLDLEIDRYVRVAARDWLRRPALSLIYENVTVRAGSAARAFQQIRVRGHAPLVEALAATFERERGVRRLGAGTRERAELLRKWMEGERSAAGLSREWAVPNAARGAARPDTDEPLFTNSELSLLAFNSRVLAMAEDPATPLGERLRFLAILSANLDEFFMVRVAGIRDATRELLEEQSDATLGRRAQLELIRERAAALVARQYRTYRECMSELRAFGPPLLAWRDLHSDARAALREQFRDEMYPALTPLAMTLAPGHPFPKVAHLSLALAVVLLDRNGGVPHLAYVELPDDLPRLIPVPNTTSFVLLEEVVRGNLDLLYPGARIDQACAFRATRAGDLSLDEDAADDLRDAVDQATRQRGSNPVVRVEVERDMPLVIRELVLEELRQETGAKVLPLSHDDICEVDGPLDLRWLRELPLPDSANMRYTPFAGRALVGDDEPLWDAIRERDLLLHHPFVSFDATVARLFRDAARDPDVVSLKATLYRTGDDSPLVDALRDAAAHGKQVVAFVELKARFEEERNVAATREIEAAGGRVVYGFVGLKNHAKVALVARREQGRLVRYVHVGTGNYNAVTARQYTDLSLFTVDEALADDVSALFNDLTGSSEPPRPLLHGALVAPRQLLPAMLERIEREIAHARAGRPARIRCKLNGLSHPEVIRALYRASDAGVEIDLVVRGICTLRPGVPGMSERIRVVSVVGRLLEHSRIYHFANGGSDEYFIGSSDLRPRNLRRRVELLVPIRDAAARAQLDDLLSSYIDDATAWELGPDGEYTQRSGGGPGTQERLMASFATGPGCVGMTTDSEAADSRR